MIVENILSVFQISWPIMHPASQRFSFLMRQVKERTKGRKNERMSERTNVWTNVRTHARTNERTHERTNEHTNKQRHERTNACTNEWRKEGRNERITWRVFFFTWKSSVFKYESSLEGSTPSGGGFCFSSSKVYSVLTMKRRIQSINEKQRATLILCDDPRRLYATTTEIRLEYRALI